MAEAAKRSHDPSTGDTPGKKPEKRRSKKSGRFVKDAKSLIRHINNIVFIKRLLSLLS